jgi:flagellar motility protein MotE (MotC chaperone)
MTTALKLDRDKSDKKRNTQIEQLANVYGSMDPKEAASLIEQLDITIALNLLQKMPEKRIAQILALMNPERALGITRMLSGAAKADGVATDSR